MFAWDPAEAVMSRNSVKAFKLLKILQYIQDYILY